MKYEPQQPLTLRFYGASDDNFVCEGGLDLKHLTDEIGCYDSDAFWQVSDPEFGSLLIFGRYAPGNHVGGWAISPIVDEDNPYRGKVLIGSRPSHYSHYIDVRVSSPLVTVTQVVKEEPK